MEPRNPRPAEATHGRTLLFYFSFLLLFFLLPLLIWGRTARDRVTLRVTAAQPTTAVADALPININVADETTLTALPGIGAARAAAIVAYRTAHGDFGSVEEIQNVPGVGEALFNRISPYITV